MPEGEVRVLRRSHGVETPELPSHGDVYWAHDSPATAQESMLLHIYHDAVVTKVRMASSPPADPSQRVGGFRFLCICPRIALFRTNGIADGRFAREGICLLMADFPDLC